MTSLTPADFRALQALGLLMMAAFIGSGMSPAMRPYANRIRLGALVIYVVVGLGIYLRRVL